jgi:hypothetical protein
MRSIVREFAFAAAALALLAGLVLADDKKPVKKPDGGGKVIVLQIDASKLAPDVLKQLLQAAGGDAKKPGADNKPTKKPDGGEKKPGSDNKPTKKPDGDKKPGGDKKPDGDKKSFTLTDAITVAERHAQGKAIKAEFAGDGFAVEVKSNKGTTTVKMDQSGNVAGDKGNKQGEKKPDGSQKPRKGKKKND